VHDNYCQPDDETMSNRDVDEDVVALDGKFHAADSAANWKVLQHSCKR
jgi:hypothetical protein